MKKSDKSAKVDVENIIKYYKEINLDDLYKLRVVKEAELTKLKYYNFNIVVIIFVFSNLFVFVNEIVKITNDNDPWIFTIYIIIFFFFCYTSIYYRNLKRNVKHKEVIDIVIKEKEDFIQMINKRDEIKELRNESLLFNQTKHY
ncbi:hypothetical protein [Chengkuizengella axinellae]|uniref:DUF2663 family protein n=1 Tax=Chengkuizengella axinellae TaxID=3064388 RepID=A0ABT9IV32_9BACL|nr:hypothetical protein [Chengkuizengella sp. 2205SS18-9]MDP5273214.1 hypothetical protein [Chengkuizengella sp. 2205SS18-9]